MANLLWGKVYFKKNMAGYLRQEPGERYSFTYDPRYLTSSHPDIAYTLPKRVEPHVSEYGLHPFFDNLVAEGWLEAAQTRLLGKRLCSRFELLLTFGEDLSGAVSVIDPEAVKFSEKKLGLTDARELAVLRSRASLSGVQPKLAVLRKKGHWHFAGAHEVSTHIAKFASPTIPEIMENEFLTTLATKALLPGEEIVEMELAPVAGVEGLALLIRRFDRDKNHEKIHFEEFAQLMNVPSTQKYEASHMDMADFIRECERCLPTEVFRLYRRILAGFLLGNTDMHLKNFAMLHADSRLTLAPVYDQVAAAIYPDYQTLALKIMGASNLPVGKLKVKHVLGLGREMGLPEEAMHLAIRELGERLDHVRAAIQKSKHGSPWLKDKIITMMEKRWNGTFNSTGRRSSAKR